MSKKRKLKNENQEIDEYLIKTNNELLVKYLSYDLKDLIIQRILKIKKLQIESNKLWLEKENLIECEHCGRVWDGFAQCDCLLYDYD